MLLAIETTGDSCAVAFFDGNRLRAELHLEAPRGHDRILASLFRQGLDMIGMQGEEIRRVAVSIGPGSFTGIRIGVSFAIGVSLASGAAIIPVPTLDAPAFALRGMGQIVRRSRVLSLISALGGSLYARLYELQPEFLPLTEPRAIPAARVADLIDENVAVVGPGALQLEGGASDAVVPDGVSLTAAAVGRLGLHLAYHGASVGPADLRPLYISDFIPKRREKG